MSVDDRVESSVSQSSGESRRGFIEILSVVVGGILGLAPFLLGLFAFLDPLFGKHKKPLSRETGESSGKEGFTQVAALNALTPGSPPQRFPVISDLQDAWNFVPDEPVGAVYIERTGETQVRVFNATCPHAGCSVSCDGEMFRCPCHNSSFNLDGTKRTSESGRENPSPRDLDKLDVDLDQLTKGEIWVKFQNFYTGREDAKPKP